MDRRWSWACPDHVRRGIVEAALQAHAIAADHNLEAGSSGHTYGTERYYRSLALIEKRMIAEGIRVIRDDGCVIEVEGRFITFANAASEAAPGCVGVRPTRGRRRRFATDQLALDFPGLESDSYLVAFHAAPLSGLTEIRFGVPRLADDRFAGWACVETWYSGSTPMAARGLSLGEQPAPGFRDQPVPEVEIGPSGQEAREFDAR